MTENKRNQHYIPQFYLRNFSLSHKPKHVGLFHVDKGIYVQSTKIRNQAAKDHYYGEDGSIDEFLASVEHDSSIGLNDLLLTTAIPNRSSFEFQRLLGLFCMLNLRNPMVIENNKLMNRDMIDSIRKSNPKVKDFGDLSVEPSHLSIVHMNMLMISEMVKMILDLNLKILYNNTSIPFITSDNPVVKYNQHLEQLKWPHPRTGFATAGIQLFLPLSDKICLMAYDDKTYKVGANRSHTLSISSENDVREFNKMQVLNCNSIVFFGDKMSEHGISRTVSDALMHNRPNQPKVEIYQGDESESEGKDLIFYTTSAIEIKLEIAGIKISSRARPLPSDGRVAHMREWPASLTD